MSEVLNRNPALGSSFILEIPGAREMNYFIQGGEVPGLSMAGVDTPFTNASASVPSNRIEFDPLNLNFIVDEEWKNWEYLFNWMKRARTGRESILETMSPLTLHLVNSNKNLNVQLQFVGAYPTFVSSIPLDTTAVDATPVTASVTFRYQDYTLVRPPK